MSFTHSFTDVTPYARFDNVPWTLAVVEESANETGPWTEIQTVPITADPTPDTPNPINLTVTQASLEEGWFRFSFDTSPSNPSPPTDPVHSPVAAPIPDAGGHYTNPTALRAELGLEVAELPDEEAWPLIVDAEDLIDEELGARLVDQTTGRKVVQDQVQAWQWDKLGRATAKLAAALRASPELAVGQRWQRVRGPDFETEGPLGPTHGPTVGAILSQTGLRRLTTSMARGRARYRLGYPSNADPVYND